MKKISKQQPERSTGNKGINPIFRSTRTNVPTGHLIFCDQTAIFLNEHQDFSNKIFKDIIKKEVNRRAQKQWDSKQKEIGERGTEGDCSSTTSKRKSTDNDKKVKFVNKIEKEFEAKFSKPGSITSTEIFNNLIDFIPQKGTSTPAEKFCRELINHIDEPDMLYYLKTLAESCSFWAERKDERLLPIVYPEHVRRHGKKIKYNFMDHRGFRNNIGNPIYNIAKNNPKLDKDKTNKNKKSKGMRVTRGVYKGLSLDYGFEACHIWYDTTEAPPLFTFIPNVVWLPRLISRLSDKVVKNDFFPPLLKSYTKDYYNTISEPLKPIVEGCWTGLKRGDVVPVEALGSFKAFGKKGGPRGFGTVKNTFGLKGSLRKNTAERIIALLEYIDTCKKGEAPDPDPQKISKRQNIIFGGEEALKDYIEEWRISGKRKKSPTTKDSKFEGGWSKAFLEAFFYEKKYDKLKLENFMKYFQPKYRAELKQLITPQKKENGAKTENAVILELETWLMHYYNAITTIQNKKDFLDYMTKNGMDLNNLNNEQLEELSKVFNIDKEAIKRNVKDSLKEEKETAKKEQSAELKKLQEFVIKLCNRYPKQSK